MYRYGSTGSNCTEAQTLAIAVGGRTIWRLFVFVELYPDDGLGSLMVVLGFVCWV